MAINTIALKKKIETLKKGLNNKFISASQKEKIKSQVEKLEKEIKASKPAKPTSSTLSKLQKLVNKKKYGVYSGKGVDLKKDADIPAKPIGKRKAKSGNTYYEYRANRIDVKQPSKKAPYPKLEQGGMMAKGGKVGMYQLMPYVNMGEKFSSPSYKETINFEGTQDEAINKANNMVDNSDRITSVEVSIINPKATNVLKMTKKIEMVRGTKMADGGMFEKPIPATMDKYGNINSEKKLQEDLKYLKEAYDNKLVTKAEYDESYNEIKEQIKLLQKKEHGGYMASGGELNLGIRKMAQEEGFTPKELGKDYELTMGQAVVEALTDANNHDAARKLVSLLEKNPKIAIKPNYPSPSDPKFKQKMAEIEKEYGSKYWEADDKTRNFAIKVSQKSGWDGYAIASAFEYLVRIDGGYHKLADNIEKAMESADSMAKGGETDYSKQTSDDFNLGEIVWDVDNKRYGTIIGIYNQYPSDKFEVRLDTDGMQPTENLRKVGSKGDKGTKEQLKEEIDGYARLVKSYPKNNYPKQLEPKMADGGYMAKGGEIISWETPYGNTTLKFKGKILEDKGDYYVVEYNNYESGDKNATTHVYKSQVLEGKMAKGGVTEKEVVESNAQMVLSQIRAVKHHAQELSNVVSTKSNIEAWVVGKIERASTDLSDITHYLEGNKDKMSMGGSVRYYSHKMDK
jgi:hypothetical protein